uniref:Uncharacterized protein n=1 Tax=Arion vulgaris TaxID=1028688 RepID=A0A0B7A7J9_9EUPU
MNQSLLERYVSTIPQLHKRSLSAYQQERCQRCADTGKNEDTRKCSHVIIHSVVMASLLSAIT